MTGKLHLDKKGTGYMNDGPCRGLSKHYLQGKKDITKLLLLSERKDYIIIDFQEPSIDL